jgi:hypothetical protein
MWRAAIGIYKYQNILQKHFVPNKFIVTLLFTDLHGIDYKVPKSV